MTVTDLNDYRAEKEGTHRRGVEDGGEKVSTRARVTRVEHDASALRAPVPLGGESRFTTKEKFTAGLLTLTGVVTLYFLARENVQKAEAQPDIPTLAQFHDNPDLAKDFRIYHPSHGEGYDALAETYYPDRRLRAASDAFRLQDAANDAALGNPPGLHAGEDIIVPRLKN